MVTIVSIPFTLLYSPCLTITSINILSLCISKKDDCVPPELKVCNTACNSEPIMSFTLPVTIAVSFAKQPAEEVTVRTYLPAAETVIVATFVAEVITPPLIACQLNVTPGVVEEPFNVVGFPKSNVLSGPAVLHWVDCIKHKGHK